MPSPDRIPPHNLESERAVLGALLLDSALLDAVLGQLTPQDFYSEGNGRIFDAILALHHDSAPIDEITVREELQRRGALQLVGGRDYVAGLTDTIPALDNTRAHAEIVADKAHVRRVIEIAAALSSRAYGDYGSVDKLIAWGLDKVGAVAASSQARGEKLAESARELAEGFLNDLDKPDLGGGNISLGLPMLKANIGPLFPGAVLVIGADTNVGKSFYTLEILMAAARDGTPAGYISIEDPRDLYRDRAVSVLAGISARNVKSPEHRTQAVRGASLLAEVDQGVWFSQCISYNEAQVMARMSFQAQRGVKLIAVDYIQEVKPSVGQQDRRNEVRWVLGRLKQHAAKLGVALLVISQLSRPKDGKTGREPSKFDLKEAGDLENSAEFIVLAWREKEHDYAPINVKLEKSKTGGVGWRWLMQREVFTTDSQGRRVMGSARLREVVDSHEHGDYDFPLVVTDYAAQLDMLNR